MPNMLFYMCILTPHFNTAPHISLYAWFWTPFPTMIILEDLWRFGNVHGDCLQVEACLDCPISISEAFSRKLALSSHPIASDGTKSLHSACAQWHFSETWTVLLSHFHSLPGWMHTLEVCGLSQDIRLPPQKLHYFNKPQRVGKREKDALLVQLSSEIFSVNSMQLETYSPSPELTCVRIHTFPHAAISLMCKYTDTYTCLQMHKYFSSVVLMHTQRQKFSYLSTRNHTRANSSLLFYTCTCCCAH